MGIGGSGSLALIRDIVRSYRISGSDLIPGKSLPEYSSASGEAKLCWPSMPKTKSLGNS